MTADPRPSVADARRLIAETTKERLETARVGLAACDGPHEPPDNLDLAAAALALVIAGRESGWVERLRVAWRQRGLGDYAPNEVDDFLRALAGTRGEGA